MPRRHMADEEYVANLRLYLSIWHLDIWSFYTLVGGFCLDIDSMTIYTACYYMRMIIQGGFYFMCRKSSIPLHE